MNGSSEQLEACERAATKRTNDEPGRVAFLFYRDKSGYGWDWKLPEGAEVIRRYRDGKPYYVSAVLYECGICDSYHPWGWNGDCREDQNRYADVEPYAAKLGVRPEEVEIRSWEDRCEADKGVEPSIYRYVPPENP